LPIKGLDKPANTRCKHQSFAKGCKVYHGPNMPAECVMWTCRWLTNDDTFELSRPDRSHYVIDVMPDFITADVDGKPTNLPVVQIWCDPKHPDAHRDPALRRYLLRRAEDGYAGLIRFNSRDAIVIFPPPFDVNGEWHEITSGMKPGKTHSAEEIFRAIGNGASEP
jgi:hypothetical protein